MSGFFTWVSNTANEMVDSDLRHSNRTLEYLHSREIEGKTLIEIVQYIKSWWPRAFSDDVVLKKLRKIVEIRRRKWSEEEAFEVYDSVMELSDDQLQSVFSHVPVLFFDKAALFNRYSQHIIRPYYHELSPRRKAKYAAKALSVNGYLLRDVPLRLVRPTDGKTKDETIQTLYEIAVHSSPGAIQFVPEAKRTPDMMRDAVCESAYALEYLAPHWQDEYLEDAIMNPDDKRETHWPSGFWRRRGDLVICKRPWLQKIFDRVDPGVLVELYKSWSIKTETEANRRQNEQAMI